MSTLTVWRINTEAWLTAPAVGIALAGQESRRLPGLIDERQHDVTDREREQERLHASDGRPPTHVVNAPCGSRPGSGERLVRVLVVQEPSALWERTIEA